MTLILAFRENDKNYLVADQCSTRYDEKSNSYIITNQESKICEGQNFALAVTNGNVGIADFFEHAIANITLENDKKSVYDMVVSLQKKIHADFIYDSKILRFSGLLVMKEAIWYFDANLSISRKKQLAVGVLRDMGNYALKLYE